MSKWAEECKRLVELCNHVHDEARRQALLEAAEMAENYETWNENILRFAELLREKAEE